MDNLDFIGSPDQAEPVGDGSKTIWSRNYSTHVRGEPERINAMERLISALQNANNLNRNQAIDMIFTAGLTALSQNPTYGSPELEDSIAKSALYQAMMRELQIVEQYDKALKRMPASRIHRIASQFGQDIDIELSDYRLPIEKFSVFARIKSFLQDHLADGKEHSKGDVCKAAVDAGIIPSPDTDKDGYEKGINNLSVAASQISASGGKRGIWQIVTNDKDMPF